MAAPIYVFDPNTPNAADPMQNTQPIILENFRAMAEYVAVNHSPFNSSDSGKHKFISLPNQDNVPTTAASEVAMFTQATPSGPNDCELFLEGPGNNSENVITPVQISNVSTPPATGGIGGFSTSFGGYGSTGFIQFSSGFILKWFGNEGTFVQGLTVYTYPTTYPNSDNSEQLVIPVFNNTVNVSLFPASANGVGNNSSWYVTNSIQTQFKWSTISGSTSLGAQTGILVLAWGF